MKEIIKRMQARIMEREKQNGFETTFDFLKEDLLELKNTNKMKKELFIETMAAIKNQYSQDYKTARHLSKAFPNTNRENLLPENHFLYNALIKVLQHEMNDTALQSTGTSWIEYFINVLDFGRKNDKYKISRNGQNIPLSNAGELYELLVNNPNLIF